MRAKKVKGKKVWDNEGFEMGKVADLGIDRDEFKIKNILVSNGRFFDKKYFTVGISEVRKIDDGLYLKSSMRDQDVAVSRDELKRTVSGTYFFKHLQSYPIISNDSHFVGIIEDMKFDLNHNLNFDIIIKQSPGGMFEKSHFTASRNEFTKQDELLILNLSKDEIERRVKLT